jgi:tetratricopeptide (TPR) repeat protein
MSFDLICSGCGAPSGPSVGICPFCKTVLHKDKNSPPKKEDTLNQIYQDGRLDLALNLSKTMYAQDKDAKINPDFLLLFAKILFDSEAPSSYINNILGEAHLIDPNNSEVLDYMEILEARRHLKKGPNDDGKIILQKILRRSPKNSHAHFILGTHLFWTDQNISMAIPHLETCVHLTPNFLRAWGCLAVIYQRLNNPQLAFRAFQKCHELENSPKMKSYFAEQMNLIFPNQKTS